MCIVHYLYVNNLRIYAQLSSVFERIIRILSFMQRYFGYYLDGMVGGETTMKRIKQFTKMERFAWQYTLVVFAVIGVVLLAKWLHLH